MPTRPSSSKWLFETASACNVETRGIEVVEHDLGGRVALELRRRAALRPVRERQDRVLCRRAIDDDVRDGRNLAIGKEPHRLSIVEPARHPACGVEGGNMRPACAARFRADLRHRRGSPVPHGLDRPSRLELPAVRPQRRRAGIQRLAAGRQSPRRRTGDDGPPIDAAVAPHPPHRAAVGDPGVDSALPCAAGDPPVRHGNAARVGIELPRGCPGPDHSHDESHARSSLPISFAGWRPTTPS